MKECGVSSGKAAASEGPILKGAIKIKNLRYSEMT